MNLDHIKGDLPGRMARPEKNMQPLFQDSERKEGMDLPMTEGWHFSEDSMRNRPDGPQWDEAKYDLFEDDLADKSKMEVDDNGTPYRLDKNLLPESRYELNGYRYETDELGRIVSAEGKLHLKDREERLPIRDSIEDIGKGDQREGDDRGHLIGDQFDGTNGLENMIPQDAKINRIDFKNFENELAREVKAGNHVELSVKPVYDGDSRRPSAIISTYCINGEQNMRIFPNGKE